MAKVQTYRCPNCREMVMANAAACRFCSSPLDPSAAAARAAEQERVNRAASDANNLKLAASSAVLLFALGCLGPGRFLFAAADAAVAVAAGVARVLYLVVACASLGAMLARWYLRYGAGRGDAPELAEARRSLRSVWGALAVMLVPLVGLAWLVLHA